jgi:hypothetical protein
MGGLCRVSEPRAVSACRVLEGEVALVTVTVFVQLLDEGTIVYRPTEAVDLGLGRYRLLPTPDYDPEDETWEFLPGAVVVCSQRWLPNGKDS